MQGQTQASYAQIVGQVIRGRREVQGINLLTMAKSLDLETPSGWSRVETGDSVMTMTQLRRAARKLGVAPAEIVREADVIAAQLEATGVVVHDDKPKTLGKVLLGGAGILAVLAAGAAMAASKASRETPAAKNAATDHRNDDDSEDDADDQEDDE
jgi:hypothetical protein